MDEQEHADILKMARAYRAKFGFPLVICAKEVDRYERVLNAGWDRMANSAGVERAANLVEIAKIANSRFDELVADANPIAAARAGVTRSEQV
jgi:2-oxo-4-hydroxy-4-carboxy--5-ureidoimidazoline (OHCU) decarboxylase